MKLYAEIPNGALYSSFKDDALATFNAPIHSSFSDDDYFISCDWKYIVLDDGILRCTDTEPEDAKLVNFKYAADYLAVYPDGTLNLNALNNGDYFLITCNGEVYFIHNNKFLLMEDNTITGKFVIKNVVQNKVIAVYRMPEHCISFDKNNSHVTCIWRDNTALLEKIENKESEQQALNLEIERLKGLLN